MSDLLDAAGNPVHPQPARIALPEGTARPRTKVLIAVPTRDELKANFNFDLVNLAVSTALSRPDIGLSYLQDRGTGLPAQRHQLAEMALKAGVDFVLWLDSDMRFPKNALVRLLAHGLPVVAANYVTRSIPARFVTHLDDHDSEKRLVTDAESTGLVEVASTGMGAMLTSTDVFRNTPAPWFGYQWHDEGGYDTEDIWFCRTIREHGYKVMIDQDLSKEIVHLGEFPYSYFHAQLTEE